MKTALIWDERFGIHDMGDGALYLPPDGLVEADLHIDNPSRIVRTRNVIRRAGLDDVLLLRTPRRATPDELTRVHSLEHVDRMREISEAGGGDAGGGFTPMDARSYDLALLSAGSALVALELVLRGEAKGAHAMVRRSGHHASRDRGFGFCIFNNVAVAARAAQARHGISRVGILDIDAHHGNGTESIFYADPDVLTISIHQDRLFPVETGGSSCLGEQKGIGRNFNVNLPAGTGDGGYLYAMDRIVTPALSAYRPELILVACGVDASCYDPMARLAVTASGFHAVGRRLRTLADELSAGLVLVQEGGYSHQYAPFCWLALIEAVACVEPPSADPFRPFLEGMASSELVPWQRQVIDESARHFEPYWREYGGG